VRVLGFFAAPAASVASAANVPLQMPLAFGLEVCWRADVPAPSADVADSWINAAERFVRYAKTHDRGHVCGVMLSTWYSFADFADALEGLPFADAVLSAKARRDRREVVQVYRALTGARRH